MLHRSQASRWLLSQRPQPEPFLTGAASLGYDSMYNFRGVDFGADAIWTGIDFNMALTESVGLNFGTWSHQPDR